MLSNQYQQKNVKYQILSLCNTYLNTLNRYFCKQEQKKNRAKIYIIFRHWMQCDAIVNNDFFPLENRCFNF